MLLASCLVYGITASAPAAPADPNRLIDERFPDHPQKVRPLAQDHVEVARSPSPDRVYLYDPHILALPDGRLLAGYGYGGPGARSHLKEQGLVDDDDKPLNAAVLSSDDGGETWTLRHRYRMRHQRFFTAGDSVYALGHLNDLRIMRSRDRGETWGEPVELTRGQTWHQSATGYWKTDSHIYIVMERRVERGVKGWQVANIAPVLMRARLDADLTRRESWTFASELVFLDALNRLALNYVGIPFQPADPKTPRVLSRSPKRFMHPMGWLETNVVQVTDPDHVWYDPSGKTFHLISRANTGGVNVATLLKVVERPDGSMKTMLETAPSGEAMLFLPWPGGHLKFYVLYDPETNLYWMVGNQPTQSMTRPERMPADRWGLPNQERHRLVLHFSRNLVDWTFAGLVAKGPTVNAARHYCSMDIDGDDLVILSRSGDRQAASAHDGNLITFHRIENFRGLVY